MVSLGPALVAALADARAAREELEDEPGWVLATPTGDHLAPEVLDRAWRRAQRRAEVPHRPIHALRHHAISRMIEAGFSPKEVQVAAGHASITTTVDRYGHVMPGTLAGQREQLAELDAWGERATAPARGARRGHRRPRRLASTGPMQTKTPHLRGFLRCAREDLNLHGPYGPQGPQPCASTNSATGAWSGEYSERGVPPWIPSGTL